MASLGVQHIRAEQSEAMRVCVRTCDRCSSGRCLVTNRVRDVQVGRVSGEVKVSRLTSWPVLCVWVVMSVLVAATSSLACLQPSWIVVHHLQRPTTGSGQLEAVSLGVYTHCYRLGELEDTVCEWYGGWTVEPRWWQTACALYGGGCIVLISCALVAVLCLGLTTDTWRQRVTTAVGHTQAAAVAILLSAVLIYPFGFGAPLVRHHCGADTGPFNAGRCRLGWSYTLAIMSSILSLYCPVLAKLSTYHIYEPDYWTYCANI